jgi:N-acetylglucosamine-6-phosphate deacetylase
VVEHPGPVLEPAGHHPPPRAPGEVGPPEAGRRGVLIRAHGAVLPGGVVGAVEIEVAGGRIVAVRPVPDPPGPRHTLVPGFVDLQVNGIGDVDVASAVGDDWSALDAALVAQGVTAWCPTLVSAPLDAYREPLARIAGAARRPGPRPAILGAHLEGPFLGERLGAHRSAAVVAPDLSWADALDPVVRLMTVCPEAPRALDLIRTLAERGVVVALGHTAAAPEVLAAGVQAGATLFTHVFNASGGIAARVPGAAGAALADDRLTVTLIADLVHVHPSTLTVALRAKPAAKVVLVTDSVALTGYDLDAGAPRLGDGTLAGSALTMDQAVRNLVGAVGVDLATAVGAAATNPARVMGAHDRGRIAPGARADLVLLDEDLGVARVWIGGEPVAG